MALIERLMGPPFAPDASRHIVVHPFAASGYEVAFGPRSVAQITQYYEMTPEDAAECDTMIALVTGTDAQRHRLIFQWEQVLLLAEVRAPCYDTPALVRTRLGI